VLHRREFLGTLSSLGLAGCLSQNPDPDPETGTETVIPPPGATGYWYTHPDPTGNRFVEGRGNLRDAEAVSIETDGTPNWLVAHPAGRGSAWTVVTEDGSVTRWSVEDREATTVGSYDLLPEETPPVVATYEDEARLVRPPEGMPVTATPAVAGVDSPKLIYVNDGGDLAVAEADESTGGSEGASVDTTSFDVDALPDARIAEVGESRYALFGDMTDRYRHGALGDNLEGSSLVVYDAEENEIVSRSEPLSPDVFEGLGPMAADVDDNSEREIVTTVANSSQGARIAVFGPEGERIATGPVHEPGWRHQLAVAPFGPDWGTEIAVVRKPHVDKVLEFYSLRDGSLDVVATLEGFQSHTYRSRNLDGAVAVDADEDGTTELLVPTAQRDEIAAVRRHPGGAEVVWRKKLEGRVTSNITGVATEDGIAVGVANRSGVRVWQG